MIFFFSFLLTIISYFTIGTIVYSLIPKEKKEEKKIYVHTAIIAKKSKVIKDANKQITKITQTSKKLEKLSKKKPQKKGSKTNITKGGEKIGFNDIFKNVDYNVPTKKVVLKAQTDMSRLKGIESKLKSLKTFHFSINLIQNSGKKLTDKEYSEIENKLYDIWSKFSILPIDYAKVIIKNINGKIYVTILDTNLDLDRQNELIKQIEQEKFNKDFDLTVFFQSKKEQND